MNSGPTSAFATGRILLTHYRVVQLSFAYFSMQAQLDDYTMGPFRLPYEPTEVKMLRSCRRLLLTGMIKIQQQQTMARVTGHVQFIT